MKFSNFTIEELKLIKNIFAEKLNSKLIKNDRYKIECWISNLAKDIYYMENIYEYKNCNNPDSLCAKGSINGMCNKPLCNYDD